MCTFLSRYRLFLSPGERPPSATAHSRQTEDEQRHSWDTAPHVADVHDR